MGLLLSHRRFFALPKFVLLVNVIVFSIANYTIIYAQNPLVNPPLSINMPPPPTDFDKCFAWCQMPNTYIDVSTQKLVKDAYTKTIEIPPVYEQISEEVLVRESRIELVLIPPIFQTVEEQVLVKEESRVLSEQYEEVTEIVKVSDATGRWIQQVDPQCISVNPNDCVLMYWEKIPARYDTIIRRVLTQLGSKLARTIPAEYKTVTKTVLLEPARIEERIIPAEYETVVRDVLVAPAKTEFIFVPAEYETVIQKQLLRNGGYYDWVEILCPQKTTVLIIRQIQQTLKDRGYYTGNVDGIVGQLTRQAIDTYQRTNELPIGRLDKATLNSLGFNYLTNNEETENKPDGDK